MDCVWCEQPVYAGSVIQTVGAYVMHPKCYVSYGSELEEMSVKKLEWKGEFFVELKLSSGTILTANKKPSWFDLLETEEPDDEATRFEMDKREKAERIERYAARAAENLPIFDD